LRILVDENLSRKLPARLAELFPESKHVFDFDLLQTGNLRIWEYAKSNGFTIVTPDADFFEPAADLGAPPKVI
jgi:predicted nuclease of predicted toxin-antitoxin system